MGKHENFNLQFYVRSGIIVRRRAVEDLHEVIKIGHVKFNKNAHDILGVKKSLGKEVRALCASIHRYFDNHIHTQNMHRRYEILQNKNYRNLVSKVSK